MTCGFNSVSTREPMIVASIDGHRESRLDSRGEPLLNDAQIEILLGQFRHFRGKRQQIVVLHAVHDADGGSLPRQRERQVMANESSAANQGDACLGGETSYARLLHGVLKSAAM